MRFQQYIFGFYLCIISGLAVSHVAGVTDTGINVNTKSIDLVYTLPVDNIDEFTDIQKINIDDTIINGITVSNTVDTIKSFCSGRITGVSTLENIQSEQFSIRYECEAALDVMSISYALFLPEYERHKNYVRLSIAGRSQSFTFSKDKLDHTVPVRKLLTAWGKAAERRRETLNQSGGSEVAALPDELQRTTPLIELLMQSRHYLLIGIEHILLGYDHVLFLIGLLLLPLSLHAMLAIITSFTIAHSITLGISVLGVFSLSAPMVEAAIALSIVYVAIENLRVLKSRSLSPAATGQIKTPWRRRIFITFCFGLLHGFGFSYVLKEIGLGEHIVGSLFFFNLGVEFGQLMITALTFPLLWYAFRKQWGAKVAISLSVLVGLMGLFWLVERLYSLL